MLIFFPGCGSGSGYTGDLKVAATVFPLYDITRNIAGDRAETLLLLRSGATPHTFEPSPSDIKRLSGASAVFSIGAGLDEWALSLARAASSSIEVYPLHKHIRLKDSGVSCSGDTHVEKACSGSGGTADPHYWLSIENASVMALNIKKYLSALDPGNASYYEKRLELYLDELSETGSLLRDILAPVKEKPFIVFHDSWKYFAREYSLDIAGVFMISPGSEPGPRHMGELYAMAADRGVEAVFAEPQFSMEVLKPFVEDTGLRLGILDPLGGADGRDSYTGMMIYNARTLREDLENKNPGD